MLGLSRVFLMLLIVTTVLHAIGSFRPTLRRIGFWADQETTKFSQAFVYSAYPTGWVIGGGGTIPRRETAGPYWEPEERASIFGVHCGALAATIRQCALGRCKELKIWGRSSLLSGYAIFHWT